MFSPAFRQTPSTTHRFLLLVVSVLLLASACGSSVDVVGATQEPALAATTSEPNRAAVEPEPATAPATDATEPERPTVEPDQPIDSVQPTETLPVAADDPATVEPADATEPDGIDSVDFAASAEGALTLDHDPGWRLDGSLDRDQVLSVLSTTMGPTSDMTATMRRLSPISFDFFTLPDTDIVEVRLSHGRDWSVDQWELVQTTTLTFVTSASREDAATTYATEMSALGWEIREREAAAGDLQVSLVDADATPTAEGVFNDVNIEILDRVEGGAIVEFRYNTIGDTDLSPATAGDSWHRPSPIPDDAIFDRFVANVTPTRGGNHNIHLESEFVDNREQAAMLELIEGRLVGAGHDVTSVMEQGFATEHRGERANVWVYDFDVDAAIYGDIQMQIVQSVIVAAEVPIAPATAGLDPNADTTTQPGAPAGEITLAEPNGPAIGPDMDAVQIEEALLTLLAPTTDVSSTVARLAPFPADMPTLPGAYVFEVDARLARSNVTDPATQASAEIHVTVGYVTTASPVDAQDAFERALVGAGWELRSAVTEERDNGEFISMSFRELKDDTTPVNLDTADIAIAESDIGTQIEITVRDRGGSDLTGLDRYAGWIGASPLPAAAEWQSARLLVTQRWSPEPRVSMEVDARLWEQTLDGARTATSDSLSASPDWALVEERTEESLTVSFKPFQSNGRIYFSDRVADDLYPVSYVDIEVAIDRTVELG